jgi:hypothetical protein
VRALAPNLGHHDARDIAAATFDGLDLESRQCQCKADAVRGDAGRELA